MDPMLIVFLALASLTDQTAPRDKPAERTQGIAIVRGRVTDAETGTPLARVDVSLRLMSTGDQWDTASNGDGAFEFTRVPAGKYRLSVDPTRRGSTHRPASYKVADQKGRVDWSTIVVREGEVFEHADVSLPRSYVITARVMDEDGTPIADALVKAEPIERFDGISLRSRGTDDLGAVRLWGYPPGVYRVCATPKQLAPDQNSSEGYVETCYPSASPVEAQPVRITSADPPEVQIRLRRTRLFRITGTVVDSNGQLAPSAVVSVVSLDREGSSSRRIQNTGGTFRAGGLPPGDYYVAAESPYESNADDTTRPLGIVPVQLQTSDADGVLVVLSAPATVRGRLVFEGGPPPPLTAVTVQSYPPRRSFSPASIRRSPPARVNVDLSFELRGMAGPRTIDVTAPAEWVVKSVRYRGEERLNLLTEFRSEGNAPSLEVVLTNRPATLVARVPQSSGAESDIGGVLLFPTDSRQWTGAGKMSAWRAGILKGDAYVFSHVRPGEYFVAVLPANLPYVRDGDIRALEELSKTAERITLLENDQRTIDLRR
jgi:carboxypeptidase family protein